MAFTPPRTSLKRKIDSYVNNEGIQQVSLNQLDQNRANAKLLKTLISKKAVIWDFDGVICSANWNYGNNFSQWWDTLWSLLKKYEPNIKKKFKDGLKYNHEHTDYVITKYGPGAYRTINNFYLKKEMSILPYSTLNEPILALIKQLDESIEQYIWSNNQERFITEALKSMSVLNKFKSIVARNKFLLAKPNLDGFKIIQSITSKTNEDFIFIGDSDKIDRVVAKKLGMEFFLYTPFKDHSAFQFK